MSRIVLGVGQQSQRHRPEAAADLVAGGGVRSYLDVGKWKLASLTWLERGHRAVTTLARV
jgi:hypothetical protein